MYMNVCMYIYICTYTYTDTYNKHTRARAHTQSRRAPYPALGDFRIHIGLGFRVYCFEDRLRVQDLGFRS